MSSVQEAMYTEWKAVRDEYSELPEIPYQQSSRKMSEHTLTRCDWDDYDEVGRVCLCVRVCVCVCVMLHMLIHGHLVLM